MRTKIILLAAVLVVCAVSQNIPEVEESSLGLFLEKSDIDLDGYDEPKGQYRLLKAGSNTMSSRTYTSKSTRSYKTKDGEDNPILEFLAGILMVAFAIPILWFNERATAQ
jgi:hypothetical protein